VSTAEAGRTEIRHDLVLLLAAAALLFLPALGARDLWSPNEPIYGKAVAEMAERGDWLIPTVNGHTFAEKPILWFWLARASGIVLGGVSELSLRLPSALVAILGVGLVYLLVAPYAGRPRARIAAVVYMTTFGVFWNARAIQMDLLVSVATLGVVAAVVRVWDRGSSSLRGWLLAGAAAGLGFLAKGPVAWVCPALVLVAYLAVTRRMKLLFSPAILAGGALCVAIVAPWLLTLAVRGHADALREMFFRQNVTRFLDPWDHAAPFWYYLEYFWIDFAPWSWIVPLAAALPGRDDEERRLDTLAWCWLGAVVFFFSLSSSKRSPYILPAAPAVAILAAGVVERFLHGTLSAGRRRAVCGLLGAIGALSVAGGILLRLRVAPAYPELSREATALALLLVAGGVAILTSFPLRRVVPAAPAAFFALVTCVYLMCAVVVLPAADSRKSARSFCEKTRAVMTAGARIASFGFWDLRASYGFYLGRTVDNLTSEAALRDYWSAPGAAYLIVETPRLAEARAVVGEREPVVRAEIGNHTSYLFSNR
jgi:4-amino-4-deoxy-L-arabinose transferase-like glycosyltransferase